MSHCPLDSCLICIAKTYFRSYKCRSDLRNHEERGITLIPISRQEYIHRPRDPQLLRKIATLEDSCKNFEVCSVTFPPLGIYLRLGNIHELDTILRGQGCVSLSERCRGKYVG